MANFIPKKSEKEVISLRIPTELLRKTEERAARADISRNAFLVQCIEFALANMEEEE